MNSQNHYVSSSSSSDIMTPPIHFTWTSTKLSVLAASGHQFKDGVTFMCLTMPHFLSNLARAENCGFQKQGHFDGAFNW